MGITGYSTNSFILIGGEGEVCASIIPFKLFLYLVMLNA